MNLEKYPYSPSTLEGEYLSSSSPGFQAELLQESFVFDDAIEENIIRSENILNFPRIPDAWKNDENLVKRYGIFLGIISTNPEWWDGWKNQIELIETRIRFKNLGFEIDLYDLPEKITWNDFNEQYGKTNNIPKMNDLEKLQKFISSLGEEYEKLLMDFLGLEEYFYWTSFELDDTVRVYLFGKRSHTRFEKTNKYLARLVYKI